MSRRKHKVTLRRSHAAYRWRTVADSVRTLLRVMTFVGSAVLVAGGGHAVWTHSAGLGIRSVTWEGPFPSGLDALGPQTGDALFGFSARALVRRIEEKHPELDRLAVSRGWDRSVKISAQRRTAVARRWDNERWWGVDAGGTVFPLPGDLPGLVLLAGPDGPPLRTALALFNDLRKTKESWTEGLYKIKMSIDGEAELFLKDGPTVFWGTPGTTGPDATETTAAKARRLTAVLNQPEGQHGYVYARFVEDRRIVVLPRTGPASSPSAKPAPKLLLRAR